MAQYSVQGPDGQTYRLNGPNGASDQQLQSALRYQLELQQRSPAAAPTSPSTTPRNIDEDAYNARQRELRKIINQEEAGFFGGIRQGFVGTGESAALGLAALYEDDEEENEARATIKGIADTFAGDSAPSEDLTYKVGAALGSIFGFMAPAVAAALSPISAGAAGVVGLVGAAGLGMASGAGEANERAQDAGATKEQRDAATRWGILIGSLEALPIGRFINLPIISSVVGAVGEKAVSGFKSRLSRAAKSGGIEGAQEVVTGFLQNVNEKTNYNPQAELVSMGLLTDDFTPAAIASAMIDLVIGRRRGGRLSATENDEVLRIEGPKGGDPLLLEGPEGEDSLLLEGPEGPQRTEDGALIMPDENGAIVPPAQEGQITPQDKQLDLFPEDLERARQEDTGAARRDLLREESGENESREQAEGIERDEDLKRKRDIKAVEKKAEANVDRGQEKAFDRNMAERDRLAGLTRTTAEREEARRLEEEAQPTPTQMDPNQLDLTDAALEKMLAEDTDLAAEAQAQLDRVNQASARETSDAVVQGSVEQGSRDRRYNLLQEVIKNTPTNNYNTLSKNFEARLAKEGITDAKANESETETIRRAVNVQQAVDPKNADVAPEVAPEARELSEMEELVPERMAPVEPTQQSFVGMGRRKAATPTQTAEQVAPTPEPRPIAAEELIGLGIPKQAAVIRQVAAEGGDLSIPAVREKLTNFTNGKNKALEAARANVAQLLNETQSQPDLFQGGTNARITETKSGGLGTRVSDGTRDVAPRGDTDGKQVTRSQQISKTKKDTKKTPSLVDRRVDDRGSSPRPNVRTTRTKQRALKKGSPRPQITKFKKVVAVKKPVTKITKNIAVKAAPKKKETKTKVLNPIDLGTKQTHADQSLHDAKDRKDPTTGADRKKITEVIAELDRGPKEKGKKRKRVKNREIKEKVAVFLDKGENLIDAIALAIHNVAYTEGKVTQGSMSNEQFKQVEGTGSDVSGQALAWFRENTGVETNKWITAELEAQLAKAKNWDDSKASAGVVQRIIDNAAAVDKGITAVDAQLKREDNEESVGTKVLAEIQAEIDWSAALKREMKAVELAEKNEATLKRKRKERDKKETPEDKKARLSKEAEIKRAFDETQRQKDWAAVMARMRKRTLSLTKDAVLASNTPLNPEVRTSLRNNDLQGALQQLAATMPNKQLAKIAKVLASVVGSTKVEVVENLKDESGNPMAGFFDPKTNTIKLDADLGMQSHTILHEMVHAAVSAQIASNPTSASVVRLKTLFEKVKGKLNTAYGATNIDEFLSEAMSNKAFRSKLARINVDGSDINALQHFVNIISNFVRQKMGVKLRKRLGVDAQKETALTEAETIFESLVAPAPVSRNASILPMTATSAGAKQTAKGLLDEFAQMRKIFNTLSKDKRMDYVFTNINKLGVKARQEFYKLMDGVDLADWMSRYASKPLGKLARLADQIMDEQRQSITDAYGITKKIEQKANEWAFGKGAEMSKKGKSKEQHLDDLVYSPEHGATIYQVDPDMTRAKAEAKYKGTIHDESGRDLFDVWLAQREDWNLMGKGGRNTFRMLRKAYADQYKELQGVLFGRVDSAIEAGMGDSEKGITREEGEKIKAGLKEQLLGKKALEVYFPLVRRGDYKLMYLQTYTTKENGKEVTRQEPVFRMFEDERSRDRVYDELVGDNTVSELKRSKGDFEIGQYTNTVPDSSLIQKIIKMVGKSDADPKVSAAIVRMYINALPESSLVKSLQTRKGTQGYETSVLSGFRDKAYSLGRQTEKLRYAARFNKIEAALSNKKQIDYESIPEDYRVQTNELRNILLQRIRFAKYGAEYKTVEGWVRTGNQIAFLFTIGFNVASALVQLAQIPMFAFPMLAGRYNMNEAYAAISAASSLVWNAKRLGETKWDKRSPAYGLDAYYDLSDNGDMTIKKKVTEGLSKEESDALLEELEMIKPLVELARKRGQLSRSFLLDAMGLEEFSSKKDWTLRKGLDVGTAASAGVFNQAERLNRQVTMVAAYVLGVKRIKAEEAGKKKADRLTPEQQQEKAAEEALLDTRRYNGSATLETATTRGQQGIWRTAFMYKNYGFRMYSTMIQTAFKTIKASGVSKEEQKIARRQAIGILGSSLLFSGVAGVPIYGAIEDFYNLIRWAEDDEDEDDFNSIVRAFVGETAYKGPFNALIEELGIGADIAPRIRLTGLLLQHNRFNRDASVEEDLMHYVGGPAWSVGKRIIRGGNYLLDGEFMRGVENIMPVGFANAYKTTPMIGRYWREDGIKSLRGDVIYDDITGGEMAMQFFGFAPAAYVRVQEQKQRAAGIDRAVNEERSNLLRQYYIAGRPEIRDHHRKREVRQEMREFNRKHPSFRVEWEDIERSMKQHARTTKDMQDGLSLSPAMRKALRSHRDNGFLTLRDFD